MVTSLRIAALLLSAMTLSAAGFHPIHAARVELEAAADGTVTATVLVYRDDFSATISLADLGKYLDRVLVVTDSRSARVSLVPVGSIAEGDRLKISLRGATPAGLSHGRIALTLLQEKFGDQVNVVDARVAGRRAQLVFLRGDGPQPLP
jgi:hypothetical protein